MNQSAPAEVILHRPQQEEDRKMLSKRAAQVQADFVIQSIDGLNCPVSQKVELVQAIIDTVSGTYQHSKKSEAE